MNNFYHYIKTCFIAGPALFALACGGGGAGSTASSGSSSTPIVVESVQSTDPTTTQTTVSKVSELSKVEQKSFSALDEKSLIIPITQHGFTSPQVYLKVSQEQSLSHHLFLGKVSSTVDFEFPFSFTKGTQSLYYEIYDREGRSISSSITLN